MAISHGYAIGDMRDQGDMYLSRALSIWPAHDHMALHSKPFLQD